MTYPFSLPFTVSPTGDVTGTKDTANLNGAAAALPVTGGQITMAPGTYYLKCGQVTINRSGVFIYAPGVFISGVGAGDVIRMYDASTYGTRTVNSGGILGFPVIDGTNTTGNSAGIHIGDIFQLRLDVTCQNFTAGTTSKCAWLDNQYYFSEQALLRIYANNGTTCIQFDSSANLSGSATPDFSRIDQDLFIKAGVNQNGVVLADGATLPDGRTFIGGNVTTSSSAQTSAVLSISGASSGFYHAFLSIGVESDGGLAHGPTTISFGSGTPAIQLCSGVMDWTNGAFASSNNSGQFQYTGNSYGDPALTPVSITGPANSQSVISSGTIFPNLYGLVTLNSGGSTSYTGLILQAGSFDGQAVEVVNLSTGTLTFAAAGTSNVADGVSNVIPALKRERFIWIAATSLWYGTV